MQGLLETLHAHHVLSELERLAFRLDGELSRNEGVPINRDVRDNKLAVRKGGSAHPVSLSSFS